MKAKAARMVREYGIELLIIDYLQLADIDSEKDKGDNAAYALAKFSRQCKLIAKSLDIPVIALSQLNRDVEKREPKRPRMSDLRDSGALEQDADGILLLYRPEYYGLETFEINKVEYDAKGAVEIIIAKNRHGRTGSVWTKADLAINRFNVENTFSNVS